MRSEIFSDIAELLIMSVCLTTHSKDTLKGIELNYLKHSNKENRFGYVDFKVAEASKVALKLNGKEVKGRKIVVVCYYLKFFWLKCKLGFGIQSS